MAGISKQAALVDSLASSIQSKIIHPAEENISFLHSEVNQLNERILLLEETTAALTAAHHRTKLTAAIAVLGLAILSVIALIIF